MRKFRRAGQLLAATTVTSVVFAGVTVAGAEESDNRVSISITNFTDFHGHLLDQGFVKPDASEIEENNLPVDDLGYLLDENGNRVVRDDIGDTTEMGAARLAALMDFVGDDNDVQIRTTSGDNVGGSAFISAISNDEYTLEALNQMDIDVSAVGNHEFDAGFNDLQERIIPASEYPILGANVLDADGNPVLEASRVIEEQGVRIGFIGTVTQQTPNKVSPAGIAGLTFADPVEAANKEAARLKENNLADVVIVLQHEDIVAVQGFNEHVDAAFGGDSHLRHLQGDDNGTLTAQAHEYGRALAEYEFTFDTEAGEIVAGSESIEMYDYTHAADLNPNAEITETIDTAEGQANVLGAEVLTTTEVPFLRGSNPEAGPGSNRGVESTANNMLAESNYRAMNAFIDGGIDLGVMNAGGVRADLAAGEVTVEDAVTIQPFGNNLAYATLSGEAILKALENQWKPGESRPRLSLGVSNNVSYAYDPTKPQGERIISVTINGEPLDPAANYKVATATFLFEGGDGYIDPADVRDLVDVGYLDVTAFSDYLRSEEGPQRRDGQAEIGVAGLDNLVAGQTVTLDLSSLNYSSEGEPQATTVTVALAGQTVTANINNELTEADAGFGENGRATVEINIPAAASGAQILRVTTDAGTDISIPVTVAPAPQEDPSTPGGVNVGDFEVDYTPSSISGSSLGTLNTTNVVVGVIVGILAVLGGIYAALIPNINLNFNF